MALSRFNMVIADIDGFYVDSLSKWIYYNYSYKFNLTVFTKRDNLECFINENKDKIDILLVNPILLSDRTYEIPAGITIFLCDNRSISKYPDAKCINKYQTGEQLLYDITVHYSQKYPDGKFLFKGNLKTKIITVFSPQGGSGKTVFSLSLGHQLALMGFKVLYVSMKNLDFSSYYLNIQDNIDSFSTLIFHLKQNKKNLYNKINKAVSYNRKLNLHYIAPPHCSLELDELLEEDIYTLFLEIKSLSKFDFIVVCTDTALNLKNLTVMDCSDQILILLKHDINSNYKLKTFSSELFKIENSRSMNISEKFSIVLNMQNDKLPEISTDLKIITNIPLISDTCTDIEKKKSSNICQLDLYTRKVAKTLSEFNEERNSGGIKYEC